MSRVLGTARTSIATWACLAALLVAGCEKSAEEKAKDKAVIECWKAVSQEARYPSEADFGFYQVEAQGGGYRVIGRVKLMTGLGTKLPHKYVCTYQRGSATVYMLAPG